MSIIDFLVFDASGFGYAYIGNAAFCIIAAALLSELTREKKKILLFIINCVIAFFIFMLVKYIYHLIIGAAYSYFFSPIISIVIYFFALYGKRTSEKIVYGSLLATVYSYTPAISHMMFSPNSVAFNMFNILFMVLLGVFLTVFSLKDFENIRWDFVLLNELICIIGIGITFVCAYYFDGTSTPVNWSNFVTCVGMIVIELFAYYLFRKLTREYNENTKKEKQRQRVASELRVIELHTNNYEKMRLLRHDLKNQYGYIQTLLRQKDYDKAEEYFEKLLKNTASPLEIVSTGNSTIDTIMNLKLSEAQDAGICVATDINVFPDINVPDTELCSVLGNLMDNAIEACEKIGGDSDKSIAVEIKQQKNLLFIRIVNDIDRSADVESVLSFTTTKKDKDMHGFGVKMVKIMSEKNNGYCNFDISDGKFTASVMMAAKI